MSSGFSLSSWWPPYLRATDTPCYDLGAMASYVTPDHMVHVTAPACNIMERTAHYITPTRDTKGKCTSSALNRGLGVNAQVIQ